MSQPVLEGQDLVRLLREYRAELGESFVIAEAAARFVKLMQDEHPDSLAAWQQAHTTSFVADALRTVLRSERSTALARSGARAFDTQRTEAADEATFAQAYCVSNGSHLWRRVAEMTADDHRYVAGQYEVRGKRQLSLAAFHRAVAKRVGTGCTADVMTEAEYDALLASFL